MATTHDIYNDIESWLAAAVHEQLSPEERAQFNEHLASCEPCRALYEEELTMSKMIEATLEEAKPDLAFEQRIVSGFRKTVPQRSGFVPLLVRLMRMRATQITALAALLLALVQVGTMLTGEGRSAAITRADARAFSTTLDAAQRRRADNVNAKAAEAAGPVPANSPPPLAQSYAAADAASRGGQSERGVGMRKTLAAQANEAAAAPPAQAADEPAPRSKAMNYSADEAEPKESSPVDPKRKLVRNAQVEIEVVKFDEAVQKITAFSGEDKGYVATSSSERQANGKLRGEVVVKVLP